MLDTSKPFGRVGQPSSLINQQGSNTMRDVFVLTIDSNKQTLNASICSMHRQTRQTRVGAFGLLLAGVDAVLHHVRADNADYMRNVRNNVHGMRGHAVNLACPGTFVEVRCSGFTLRLHRVTASHWSLVQRGVTDLHTAAKKHA
jgi:hypothetical protein